MQVNLYNKSFPYIIVDEFYSSEELRKIWNEIEFLSPEHKWFTPDSHPDDGAKEESGEQMRQNCFRWMDDVYRDSQDSDILTISKKLFTPEIYRATFGAHSHWFIRDFRANLCNTLLSYYAKTGDNYKPHVDYAVVTCLTWFYKEPKQFDNGDVTLYNDEEKIDIPIKNNRMLIFPSSILHQAHPITTKSAFKDGDGRYCLAQFLFTVPENLVPGDFSWS